MTDINRPETIAEEEDPYKLLDPPDISAVSPGDNFNAQSSWLERNAPTAIPPALLGTGTFAGGILREYKLRFTPSMLKSDFLDGFSLKTKSASLFMFCATMTSTVALGEVAYRETDAYVGITEYLMLQGVSGVLHTLFSACPMPILRPTGPITAFMIDLYKLTADIGVDYYTLVSWVGMWVGSSLVLIAVFDLSRYIVLCTRFLHDIYAAFVCTIYITDGIAGVVERFDLVEWDQAFFAFFLALFCLLFSLGFYYLDRMSTIFNQRWRHALSDYAVPIAVALCIWISYSVKDQVQVERISLPRNFEPTYQRSWYQGLDLGGDDTAKLALLSFVAAIPITALFYIDHLFSCILAQKPELGLQKGEYYHSSMLVTGICNIILPSFGLPFVTASLPHSPQFTKALTDYDKSQSPPKVLKVHESRVAPLIVYILCFLALVFPSVLEHCPVGVVNGVLTFVGLQGILPFTGNQFIDRVVLLFTHPEEFSTLPESSSSYLQLPWYRIHLYTLVQIACLAACWGMRFTGPFALAFPLVVVGFIPIRLYLLPKIFSPEELELLDSEGGERKTSSSNDADEDEKGMRKGQAYEHPPLPAWRSWLS